ncbi:MAG TPA: tetratricopeptide repeat protein [Thermoanaerobaculia bacterium]|nr:tetratricopeptide repeat protein [Thermoanaerobaculia bacterium]
MKRSYVLGGLVILVALVFGSVATHGFINFDDPDYLAGAHQGIRYAFTSLKPFYWQPLTWLSLMLDVRLFGDRPGAMLVENVLLHAISTLLLFLTFYTATKNVNRSAAVAVLWAIHPLRVESVAWVAERKDVLSTLFFIAAMLAYVNRRYALVILAFILAVMAKPMALTLPLALMLLDVWPLQRKPTWVDKIPLFAISAAVLGVTFVGQEHALASIPLSVRIANAITAYAAYLRKFFVPTQLAILYPYDYDIAPFVVAICLLILAAITFLVFRNKHRYLAVGWLWYVITIVPVIGIVQAGAQSMADRFLYIPSIGLTFAVVWLAADHLAATTSKYAAIAAVVILSILSIYQTTFWKDSVTVWARAVAVTTDNASAEMHLAAALDAEGRTDEAMPHYVEAARESHGAPVPLFQAGNALLRAKRYSDAVSPLEQAMALDPTLDGGQESLGVALLNAGRPSEAIPHLEASPKTASVWNNLALAYERKNDVAKADKAFAEAIRRDPNLYDARMNYVALLSATNRNDEALAQLAAAARIAPASVEPHIFRALVLANLGRHSEAAEEAEAAQKIDAKAANDQFTATLRLRPNDGNLAQFISSMRYSQ